MVDVWTEIMTKRGPRCCTVLCLSHSWAVSEWGESLCCWCASLLLLLSHCRLSSLLNVFCTSGSILWPGIIVSLSLPSYCELKQTLRDTCWRVRKFVYFSRKPIRDRHTYIHTYKHNLRLRSHKCPPHPHDYVPHARVFGNVWYLHYITVCLPTPNRHSQ